MATRLSTFNRRSAAACCLALMLAAGLVADRARGQNMLGTDFKVGLENYPPPNEAQAKTMLEGAQAQVQPEGLYSLMDAKLKTFSTNGALEITGETPQCIFDSRNRTASSSRQLQLRTADGRFFLEGEGFLWSQASSSLIISNRVHTIVHKDLLAGASAGPATASRTAQSAGGDNVEVFSDTFEYDRNSGSAFYRGHLRVIGTDLKLAADDLSLQLPLAGTALKRIAAEGNVVIDRGELQATAEHAVYSADSEVVTLTGNPEWRMGRRAGQGDELTLDRTGGIFRAEGHAHLRFPRESAGTTLLLESNPPATNAPGSTNRFIEVTSGSYELSTNRAVFRGRVQSTEFAGDQPRAKLNCGLMTVAFADSNQVQRILARNNVVVRQDNRRVTANEAVFSATNSTVQFKGNPKWQWGSRRGGADLLVFNRADNEMKAVGNAEMVLPSSQVRVTQMSPETVSNDQAAAPAGKGMSEITCDEYSLKEDRSLFRGSVSLRNPAGRLWCDRLTVELSQRPGGESRSALAEGLNRRVEIVWVDNLGVTNFASSDKAEYYYSVTNAVTNELVTLSGNVVITNPLRTATGDSIVWDRVHNTYSAPNLRSVGTIRGSNPPALFGTRNRPDTNSSVNPPARIPRAPDGRTTGTLNR